MSWFSPAMMWLAAAVVFMIIEAIVPGLISIWFAIGALAGMICALFHGAVWLQFVWFAAISVLTLALTRPLAKKYVNGSAKPTNADMVIGQNCTVIETINNVNGTGAVSVGGKVWTARSDSGDIITEGTQSVVLRIEGVKLIIK